MRLSRLLIRILFESLATVALCLLTVNPAAAVHTDFELDGDTADSAANPADDWDNVYKSVTGLGTAGPSSALSQTFLPDSATPDVTTFATGAQDPDPASTGAHAWQCNSDNNPEKQTNIFEAYAALYRIGTNLQLYFGANREDDEGTKTLGFWFLQDALDCTSPQNGAATFTGKKRHGDFLVVGDFSTGGDIPTAYKLYMWTDPTPGAPESGDECLGDGVNCTTSTQDFPLAVGGDCQVNPHDNPDFCGTVNITDISAAWRPTIGAQRFWEAGVNLTQIPALSGRCYQTVMAESRSSVGLLTADLKDFVLGGFTTCGGITIRKVTVGGDGSFEFDVTVGTLAPSQFTLQNGGIHTFSPVPAGSYTIQEATPAGWTLGIQCSTSGTGTSATPDQGTNSVQITLGDVGSVDCTFTNTKKGQLTVSKVTAPNDTVTPFSITASSSTGGSISGNPTGSLVTGSPVTYEVTSGTYSVSETPAAGWDQTDNTCVNVVVAAGDAKTCIITNTKRGHLIVSKVTVPNDTSVGFGITAGSGTGGSIPGNATRTLATGSPVDYEVTPGTYSVDEASASGWSETGNTCSGIRVAAGETKRCTITNSQVIASNLATLTVIKHVVNNNGGTKHAGDFMMTVTGTNVSTPSFSGSEAGTPVTLSPGAYSADEIAVAGYAKTLGADCAGVIAAGESRTCTITNTDVRSASATFCQKASVTSLLDPRGRRFLNNKGVDNLVRVDLGESIQDALDTATDANGDGYIIIGVIAGPTNALGGHTTQKIVIDRAYPKPFALVGCSVTLHDPDRSDGQPTARIAASASSPAVGANPGNILVIDLHAADSEVAGWKVEGDGRDLRNLNASDNAIGIWIAGNANSLSNGVIQHNTGSGILITGSGNAVNSSQAIGNLGHGVETPGNGNQLLKLNVGDRGKGNGGDGINVAGASNVVSEASAYANAGHGVTVGGNANQVLKSVAGDVGKGNGGDGFHVGAAGTLLQENKANSNAGDGFDIAGGTAGAPNKLKSNQSNSTGGNSGTENVGAEYRLLNQVTNLGGGNRADATVVPKTSGAQKCPAFPATNATVNFTIQSVCE